MPEAIGLSFLYPHPKKLLRHIKKPFKHFGQRKVRTNLFIAKRVKRLFKLFGIKSNIPCLEITLAIRISGKSAQVIQFLLCSLLGMISKLFQKGVHLISARRHAVFKRIPGVIGITQKSRHLGAKGKNLHHQRSVIKLAGVWPKL